MIVRRLFMLILAAFCVIPAASGNTFMLRATTRALSDGKAKEKTSVKKKTTTKKKESAVKKDSTKHHHTTTEEKKSTTKKHHHHTTVTTTKEETKKVVASEDAEQPSGNEESQDEEREKSAAASKEDSPEEVGESNAQEANDESKSAENDQAEESKSVEEDPDEESEQVEQDPDEEEPEQKAAASDEVEPDGDEGEQDGAQEPHGEANESQEEDQGQEPEEPEQPQEGDNEAYDESQDNGDSKDGTEIKPEDGESDSTTTDPCQNITECAECEKVDSESISEDKACAWKDSKCQLVDKDDVPSESVCETEATSAAEKVAEDKDDEEEASFLPGFVTIAVVVGILFAVRTYAENAGVDIPGVGNPSPRNGSGRSSRNHETVPLAGADEDDWGWEDSPGGDVELPSRANANQEDEDLRMAMALSLSESPTVPPPKQIGNATRRSNSGSRTSTPASAGRADDWDDWEENSSPASSTRVVPAPVSAPAPAIPAAKITSLGATRQTSIRKPQPPKPKQDDIFASMGLAAKPTFASPPSSRPAAPATTSGLAAAAEDISADSADWGDDSDLDDLLDD